MRKSEFVTTREKKKAKIRAKQERLKKRLEESGVLKTRRGRVKKEDWVNPDAEICCVCGNPITGHFKKVIAKGKCNDRVIMCKKTCEIGSDRWFYSLISLTSMFEQLRSGIKPPINYDLIDTYVGSDGLRRRTLRFKKGE
jgi:hypothetical protein